MIYVDEPRKVPSRGKTAHMITDGVTEELVQFVQRLGMKPSWIQREGTEYEHFDLLNSKIKHAVEAGAKQVSTRELIRIIRGKKLK